MDMKMNELARVGFVVSRQPEKHRVRVEFRDTVTAKLVSGWLPVLVPRASADMAFDLPDVGDQVLCLFLGNGLEEGFVLGSMSGRRPRPCRAATSSTGRSATARRLSTTAPRTNSGLRSEATWRPA